MKLNAGSGEGTKGYNSDFVNIDLLKPYKGVQGDILNLPFKDDSFEEVRLIHVLEHVLRHQQMPMLRELHRITAPGGVFYCEVPDFLENMVELVRVYHARPVNWEHVRIKTVGVYGKQRSTGDCHHWGYNEYFLTRQLSAFQWRRIERSHEMISNHHRVENVILMKCVK